MRALNVCASNVRASHVNVAGADDEGGSCNTAYTFFQVQFTLTTEGLNAEPGRGLAPVGLLFEYIELLKQEGPQRWVWDESRRVSDMRFRCCPDKIVNKELFSKP